MGGKQQRPDGQKAETMNEEQIFMLMELSMDTAFRKAFAKARKANFATDAIEEIYEVWNEAAERAASQIDEVKS